jgi:hypothetical protein
MWIISLQMQNAKGRSMLSFTTDRENGLMELVVEGAMHRSEYEAVVIAIDELLKIHDKIDIVEIVRDIGWIEPQLWWKDLIFHFHHRKFLRRAAIVSDKGWIGPIVRLLAPLYPAAMRVFREDEIELARAWAKAPDEKTATAA